MVDGKEVAPTVDVSSQILEAIAQLSMKVDQQKEELNQLRRDVDRNQGGNHLPGAFRFAPVRNVECAPGEQNANRCNEGRFDDLEGDNEGNGRYL
ncbi:OLC1v1016335C1 [Oldenlandia corymbosa var. corymbosa]|uniref:OLC1v1016335C1 n=1 Tax=Oldenlandia corymbosa var. corymbosa TaxID=529605 RepID=A0AAV1E563_OLDCO|nr:OLC1v1016335C1 [Oldenlandia corymbosa var. corymbosa]